MANTDRLNLDMCEDIETIHSNLLKDVREATNHAKRRIAHDAACEEREKAKSRDRRTMISIVAAATVLIVALAYFIMFAHGSGEEAQLHSSPQFTINMNPAPRTSEPVYTPTTPTVTPRPAAPYSEPVRRNPSETYDDGPQGSGM